MQPFNRRDFIKTSVLATSVAAAGVSINAVGANDRVVLGWMGCGGRGTYLATEIFAKRPDVEIRYGADPDSDRARSFADQMEKLTGKRPEVMQDFRKFLEDPELDGVVSATPDHWHALGTIWSCQAGKDVYVEKPTSHSIWESRKMVEAARKYNRVVQVGAQNRSAEYFVKAMEYVRGEKFGKIHFARVVNSKLRPSIGKKPDGEAPPGVDYDLWLGPAPARPFNPNNYHYNWHWFWDFSGGDIINDGIHQIDIARALIGEKYPKAVSSGGGVHFYNDDQETPDTHSVIWEYPNITMVFEQTLWSPYMKKTPMEIRDLDTLPNWPFSGTRIELYGEKEFMYFGRHGGGWEVFNVDGKSELVTHGYFMKSQEDHAANFIDCIRSRNLPKSDIEELHYSTLLSHYGNIAYRTGRRLHIDQATEGFVNDDEANALVKRKYREPYVVPETV
ncbi:MAG: Gfo/Idh/MocA family oxidoreductase [Candidatus Hydrogenedentes bacterium]|nr:Gfo/Idh/MocA family oxidoreductase [Candidatus Hydrogenedentota bacterium]